MKHEPTKETLPRSLDLGDEFLNAFIREALDRVGDACGEARRVPRGQFPVRLIIQE